MFAPKGDDPKGRFTINFAPLNAKLLDYVHNLPRIEEVLDILGKKGRIYSGFDLKDAFHQLPIHIEDRAMLTFTSSSGRWQYTRLPQGMKMSTSHFQEVISRTLGEHIYKDVMVYVDDMFVFTKTYREHVEVLRSIFTLLKRDNLKLKKEKCNIFTKKLKVLGFELSEEGISPCKEKVEAISGAPYPKNANN